MVKTFFLHLYNHLAGRVLRVWTTRTIIFTVKKRAEIEFGLRRIVIRKENKLLVTTLQTEIFMYNLLQARNKVCDLENHYLKVKNQNASFLPETR